jgi:hypothetical protein
VISSGLHTLVLRIFFPSTYALHQHQATSPSQPGLRRSSTSSTSSSENLFPAADAEAMVGFDMHPSGAPRDIDPREAQRRRRENMERFAGRNMAYARAMGYETEPDADGGGLMGGRGNTAQNDRVQPERRLSRELEAGFRDDSDDDDDDEDDNRGVTVGRRSFSAVR